MQLNGLKITWLGHATFLLEGNGKSVLIDPWLSGNPSCPEKFHQLSADLILVTHGHSDHVGDLFEVAVRNHAPVFGIYDLVMWAGSKGIPSARLVGANKGGTVRFDDLRLSVTLTDAHHSSSYTEEDGTIVYLGEPCGLVVSFDDGPTVYHAGDTCLFSDMEWIGKLWSPDLAILPIGDRFTMDPRQAAHAAALLDVRGVIPCHWGTFPALTGTPQQFAKEVEALGVDTEVINMRPGDTIGS